MTIMSDSLAIDLAERGIKIISIEGRGNTTRNVEILKFLLKESCKKPCLMLDNHSAAQRESLKWIEGELVKKRMHIHP